MFNPDPMKMKILTGCFLLSIFLFASCVDDSENKVTAGIINILAADSARMADSIEAEEKRAKEEEENRHLNFDFTGSWSCEPMSLVFEGDSAKFDPGSGKGTWCKYMVNRSKNPMWLEMTKFYPNGKSVIGYNMLLSLIDKNTLRVAFSKDLVTRPTFMDSTNSVEFIR